MLTTSSATDAYPLLQEKAAEAAAALKERAAADTANAEELLEYASFLDWLVEDNFVFLGYREYDIFSQDGSDHLGVTAGSGLGILSDEQRSAYRAPVKLQDIHPGLRERITGGPTLIVTKTSAKARCTAPRAWTTSASRN